MVERAAAETAALRFGCGFAALGTLPFLLRAARPVLPLDGSCRPAKSCLWARPEHFAIDFEVPLRH
jgi:hypothetical protein